MEIESVKSAIISRVKEINMLEETKKEYLKDMRERINILKEEVVNLTVELEAVEREELSRDADTLLA